MKQIEWIILFVLIQAILSNDLFFFCRMNFSMFSFDMTGHINVVRISMSTKGAENRLPILKSIVNVLTKNEKLKIHSERMNHEKMANIQVQTNGFSCGYGGKFV